MPLKITLIVVMLCASISCFAKPEINKEKSTESNQQSQIIQSDSIGIKEDPQLDQKSKTIKKPSMADYCKKHTC